VANDVHGKNHHRAGTFGAHVIGLGLLRSDGRRLTLSEKIEPELFCATIGGLGLTGVIEWVELELVHIQSAYLDVEMVPYGSLDEFWSLAEASVGQYEHTVAWIDCMSSGARAGRGIFTRANWAEDGRLDIAEDRALATLPFELPTFPLRRLPAAMFNEFYHSLHRLRKAKVRRHHSSFFYPLDAIANWNRVYGSAGMLQYQCAIPPASQRAGVRALLDEIARSGQACFLAVVKTFGDRPSPGMLSFPRPGATLALDFPNRGEETLSLLSRLDEILREASGALYPAKDGRMPAAMFRSAYPRWEAFAALKDPRLSSDFWRRVSQ
jgi:FAD/FMN-containing dehydrogenase